MQNNNFYKSFIKKNTSFDYFNLFNLKIYLIIKK